MCGMSGINICKGKWRLVCNKPLLILIDILLIDFQLKMMRTMTTTSKLVTDKSVPWPLKVDKNGYPTLPEVQDKSLPDVKDIVRSFVTMSYRMIFYLSFNISFLISI